MPVTGDLVKEADLVDQVESGAIQGMAGRLD